MTREVTVLDVGQTVTDARCQIEASRHSAYPVVDDDRRCVGIVSRSDLLGPDAGADAPLSTIANADVVTIAPEDTLLSALERIIEEEVDHLPVTDEEHHIVGMCTRTDILRARSRHLTAEQSQQGWHAMWRRKRSLGAAELADNALRFIRCGHGTHVYDKNGALEHRRAGHCPPLSQPRRPPRQEPGSSTRRRRAATATNPPSRGSSRSAPWLSSAGRRWSCSVRTAWSSSAGS